MKIFYGESNLQLAEGIDNISSGHQTFSRLYSSTIPHLGTKLLAGYTQQHLTGVPNLQRAVDVNSISPGYQTFRGLMTSTIAHQGTKPSAG